jgi:hypothetical protein
MGHARGRPAARNFRNNTHRFPRASSHFLYLLGARGDPRRRFLFSHAAQLFRAPAP